VKNLLPRIEAEMKHWPPQLRKLQSAGLEALIALHPRDSHEIAAVVANDRVDNRLRVGCAWALGMIKDKRAISALASGLKSRSHGLAWECALAIAKIGGRGAEKVLVAALERRGNPERRIAAIAALGNMSSKKAVPHLVEILRDRRLPPRMRGEAAEALGKIGGKRASRSLLSATSDKSVAVRFWAVYGLGQAGDKAALPRLRELARSDRGKLTGWGPVAREARDATRQILSKRSVQDPHR
jgi:HEAT repeat protein